MIYSVRAKCRCREDESCDPVHAPESQGYESEEHDRDETRELTPTDASSHSQAEWKRDESSRHGVSIFDTEQCFVPATALTQAR